MTLDGWGASSDVEVALEREEKRQAAAVHKKKGGVRPVVRDDGRAEARTCGHGVSPSRLTVTMLDPTEGRLRPAGLLSASKVPDSKGRFPPPVGEIGTFCLRRDGRETYSGAMPWGLSAGITIYSEGVASVPQKGEEGRGVGSTGDW